MRDLRVYAQPLGGQLSHYRDSNGLEADAIIELPGGRWAAFEVKLGSSPAVADAAAAGLLRLATIVDGPPPVAMGVITGTGYSLVRPDGVLHPAGEVGLVTEAGLAAPGPARVGAVLAVAAARERPVVAEPPTADAREQAPEGVDPATVPRSPNTGRGS